MAVAGGGLGVYFATQKLTALAPTPEPEPISEPTPNTTPETHVGSEEFRDYCKTAGV